MKPNPYVVVRPQSIEYRLLRWYGTKLKSLKVANWGISGSGNYYPLAWKLPKGTLRSICESVVGECGCKHKSKLTANDQAFLEYASQFLKQWYRETKKEEVVAAAVTNLGVVLRKRFPCASQDDVLRVSRRLAENLELKSIHELVDHVGVALNSGKRARQDALATFLQVFARSKDDSESDL